MTTEEMLEDLLDCTILSDWEVEFVDSVDKQRRNSGFVFSQKQASRISQIHKDRIVLEKNGRHREVM